MANGTLSIVWLGLLGLYLIALLTACSSEPLPHPYATTKIPSILHGAP